VRGLDDMDFESLISRDEVDFINIASSYIKEI
jgi:hypothetical protein